MVQNQVTIVNKRGLHARAAAKFVILAARFSSNIYLCREHQRLNGKSIMGIMSLAASKGTVLEIQAEGADEMEALQALVELISSGFDEKD